MFNLLKSEFDLKSHPAVVYGRTLIGQLLSMALQLLVAAAITTVALYVSQLAWIAYTDTPVGQRFVASFPHRASVYTDLFRRDFISLATQVTLLAFGIVQPIAVGCQLFYLIRLFYYPFGVLRKVAFWGLPLTALVAHHVQNRMGIYPFQTALLLAAVPTLCIFGGCLRMAKQLLPEIGSLVRLMAELLRLKR